MRLSRSPLLLLALLPFMAPGSVQASDPAAPKVAGPLTMEHADVVVARLMSFDADGSGTIAAGELPERMQVLMARGDADGNGVIDEDEARVLPGMPFRRATAKAAILSSGTYGFADDITLSSRSHVEGALDDLRLPAGTRQEAFAIAGRFIDAHESAARAALLEELADVLPAAHLAQLGTAVDMALPPFAVTGPTLAAAVSAMPGNLAAVRVFSGAGTSEGSAQFTVHVRPDLSRFLRSQPFTPEQRAAAESAAKRFKERLRLDAAAQGALLDAMSGVLDSEAHDDFRAALGRRPVVARGGQLFFQSVGHGQRVTGQVDVVPLIHRMSR